MYFSPGDIHWWFRPLYDGATFVVGIKSENAPSVTHDTLIDFVIDNKVSGVFSDVVYGDIVTLFREHIDGNGIF